uniref:Uncharacterized protein n=1 Tax=Anguilla anguilla TaxID=7936 RepID=A0A0E9RE72_ANGAN
MCQCIAHVSKRSREEQAQGYNPTVVYSSSMELSGLIIPHNKREIMAEKHLL